MRGGGGEGRIGCRRLSGMIEWLVGGKKRVSLQRWSLGVLYHGNSILRRHLGVSSLSSIVFSYHIEQGVFGALILLRSAYFERRAIH